MEPPVIKGTEKRNTGDGKQITIHSELYELPNTPEIFIDGMQGFTLVSTTVKLNFFTRGPYPPAVEEGQTERHDVACRLVMGVDTFISLVELLNTIDNEVREKLSPVLPQLVPPKKA